jgi:hypothetical protein
MTLDRETFLVLGDVLISVRAGVVGKADAKDGFPGLDPSVLLKELEDRLASLSAFMRRSDVRAAPPRGGTPHVIVSEAVDVAVAAVALAAWFRPDLGIPLREEPPRRRKGRGECGV